MKRYYILHYFDPANVGSFLLVSLLGLILVLALVLLIAKLQIQRQLKEETEEKAKKIRRKKHQRRQYQIVESFYELVFSGTSILLFLSLYYIIDERLPQISMYWEKYQDVVLLVFIVLSVFLTSWLDVGLGKLTHLDPEQKASVRLISVFYIVLILLYIRFIYEDTNYDGLILYFLTLTVGRFLYFDFTVKSFLETMRGVLENLPSCHHERLLRFRVLVWVPCRLSAEIKWCHFEHLSCPSVYGLLDLSAPQDRNFKACDTKNLKPAFFYQPYIKSSADQNFAFSVLQSFSYLTFFFTCQTAVQSHVRQKLPARRSHTGKRQHRLPICRQAPA